MKSCYVCNIAYIVRVMKRNNGSISLQIASEQLNLRALFFNEFTPMMNISVHVLFLFLNVLAGIPKLLHCTRAAYFVNSAEGTCLHILFLCAYCDYGTYNRYYCSRV